MTEARQRTVSPATDPVADATADRESLRLSEKRYRRIFETAQDGILLVNADSAQIEDVNPYLMHLLGYSRTEFCRRKLWDIGRVADIAQCKEMFATLQATGHVRYEHLPLNTSAGVNIDVEVVANSYDSDGVKVIQCNIRNITERVRMERELHAVSGRYRGLVEQAIVGIYIVQDEQFVYVNPRGAQIIGHTSVDTVIGTSPMDWVVEPDRALVAEAMRRLYAGEATSLEFEVGVPRRDGGTTAVSIHAAIATHLGRPALIGLLHDISEKKHAERLTLHHIGQLEAALRNTIELVTVIGELRDPYTAGHERRVARIALAIGAELGLDADQQEGLRVAGFLHDIGKFGVPLEILTKPGKLTALEFRLIQEHARASYNILKVIDFPWPVAQVALQHHERMDGSGYPQGLEGETILFEARIMAVADVVEAMSSHRPYRAGLGIERALAEIEHGCGIAYDAAVAAACLRLFREKGFELPR